MLHGFRHPALYAVLAIILLVGGCASSEPTAAGPETREVFAASFTRVINPFDVLDGFGRSFEHAFLGGFNVPRPQFVDIDGDGDPDLFVQEYTNKVMFFEHTGTTGAGSLTWRSDHYRELDTGEWYRFADVDGDGDFDLLTEQPYSHIRYYANVGTAQEARFVVEADTLRDVSGNPIFSDRQNIPNVTDIDCDGLPDLFIGKLDGTITHYAGVSAESDEAPVFRFVTDRFENIEIVAQFGQPGQMNQPPMPNIPGGNRPDGGGFGANGSGVVLPLYEDDLVDGLRAHGSGTGATILSNGSNLHGANTMAFADIDEDGDSDLFWGDFFEPSVLLIENTGSCQTPILRGEPRPFPPPDPMVSSGYNAPAFADINADGRLDFFAGVLGGAFNPNRTLHAPFYFYEQSGDNHFQLRTRRFLHQIDVGSESFPALADLDGDGDLDLLVGNKISSEASNTAVLTRFENIGSTSAPRFVLRDSLNLHASYHYAPAPGDLDGDGRVDILLGTWNDGVAYYRNTGDTLELIDESFVQLTRGSHTTPVLVDIDADGDLDLFVGETSGTINYYENTGDRAAPAFELISDEYQNIDVGRRSVPAFLDIDDDGDYDMIVGSEDRGLLVFRNTGSASEASFEQIDAITEGIPSLSAPAFADLDGDDHFDMLVGTLGGGLLYFSGSER